MRNISKTQFISGAFWKICEQFSTKAVSLVISIVLMRLLLPEDYGLIALTTVFTNLSDILIDGGFSTALIRKESVDEFDYGSALAISLSISVVLYGALFVSAGFISSYYGTLQLAPVLRVVGLLFFIQAFAVVRTALVNRQMRFDLLFRCNIAATLISGVVGIIAAKNGYGVWAIVIQRLLQQLILTLLLLVSLKTKVVLKINKSRLKELFSFSIGVVSSSMINFLGGSLYTLIVGKRYSVDELGYYDKGAQFPTQLSLYTFGAMSSVLLPTLSSYQNDIPKVKQIIRRVTRMTAYMITPMMVGLALVSVEVIRLLLTDVWLPSAPIMRASCLYYFATPFMLIHVQVFFALGRSFLRTKTELIRLVMLICGVLVFGFWLKCDVNELSIVCAVVAVLSALVTFIEVKKLIKYNFKELLQDLWKPCLATAVMAATTVFVGKMLTITGISSSIVLLIGKIIPAVFIYIVMSCALRIPEYKELLDLLMSKFGKVKQSE